MSRWSQQLSGLELLVYTDNITAAAVVWRRGSTKLMLLSRVARDLEEVCDRHAIRLDAAHVAGEHNVVANVLSHCRPQPLEWKLSTEAFRRICWKWGVPEVDLCATFEKAKTELFVSPLPTADL